ncbi:MAG: hypothetical protein ACI9IO_000057 [Cyanobium sp.]|jgi:hypothetical protein
MEKRISAGTSNHQGEVPASLKITITGKERRECGLMQEGRFIATLPAVRFK